MICRMTGIICPYANENGYCDSTACHNMNIVGNIIPKERPENISNSSIWVKHQSNWHTGTPTEEGWYLMKVKLDDEIIYDTNYLTPCVYGMDWRYAHEEIIEWQKIEEKENGHAD